MTLHHHESENVTKTVGIRELHNRTSELVKLVQGGAELLITARGKPVARLEPISQDDPVDRLIEQGLIRRGKRTGWVPTPIELPEGVTVSDLVKEQRR